MDLQESSLKKRKNKNKCKFGLFQNLGCMRLKNEVPVVQKQDHGNSFNVEAISDEKQTHLIVMVNGIIGSAQNWRFAAKQFVKAYPDDVIVHCKLYFLFPGVLTLVPIIFILLHFDGVIYSKTFAICTGSCFDVVDVMGKRLADEVILVVNRHPMLQKISFVGHSLGGLIARYTIAVLYGQDMERKSGEENSENRTREKIAGLDPMNFITSGTPHLGSRGHNQVPLFCGFYTIDKAAAHSSWLLGRTGKHLFLRDTDTGKPPLLLQMSSDSDDLRFMNLVKISKYRHVFSEQASKAINPQQGSLDNRVPRGMTGEMEESMFRGLTGMTWERFDVNFSGSVQQLLAHNTIQVKIYCINYHGAGVIQHMIDNFHL